MNHQDDDHDDNDYGDDDDDDVFTVLHKSVSKYWNNTEPQLLKMHLLWNLSSHHWAISSILTFCRKVNGLVSSQCPYLFRNIGSPEVPWPKVNRSFKQTGVWWLTMVNMMAESKVPFNQTRHNWASQFSAK